MTRADFWCRVVGWLQIAFVVAVMVFVLVFWEFFLLFIPFLDDPVVKSLFWLFASVFILPYFFTGLLTVLFANAVQQSREGLRGQSKVLLRVVLALSGLWAAGAVTFAGLAVPPLAPMPVLALVSVAAAIMGPDWTADLFKRKEPTP